jgi:hypothetical protein
MASDLENKLGAFFKKAASDVKKAATDVKNEAQRLAGDEGERKKLAGTLLGAAKAAANTMGQAVGGAAKGAEKAVKKFTGPTPGMNPELYETAKSERVMTDGPSKYAGIEVEPDGAKVATLPLPDITPPDPPSKKPLGRAAPPPTAKPKKTIGRAKPNDTVEDE